MKPFHFPNFKTLSQGERTSLLLEWLVQPGAFPSRNRFFENYKDPDFQALTQRCRRLKGLVTDLRAAHPAPVQCISNGKNKWWFYFSFTALRRQTLLDDADAALVLSALEGTPMYRPFHCAWEEAEKKRNDDENKEERTGR